MDPKRIPGFLGILMLAAVASSVLLWQRGDSVSAAGAASIDLGGTHSCAVTSEGGVRCWGANGFGQLGDGTNVSRATPVDVVGLESGVTAVSAGGWHTCALTDAGGVKCWGSNAWGNLGNGSEEPYSTVPVDAAGLDSGVTAISAGADHVCAVTSGGGVKCWGMNIHGELGDGTTTDRYEPVDVVGLPSAVVSVAAGQIGTCALTDGDAVLCWGPGAPAVVPGMESGVNAISMYSQVCALTGSGGVKCGSPAADVPGLDSGVVDVATGGSESCAVTSEGGVRCWEAGGTPVDVVGLGGVAVAVSGGEWHTCALMAAGNVKCWGWSSSGQLGNGTLGVSETPVDVLDLKPGSCPPEGCPTPPAPGIPLPDCPEVTSGSGTPGMSLGGPATVLVGDAFTVCVESDPEPAVAVAGFQTEVEFPGGLEWVQRPACASSVGTGEVQATVAGSLPGLCQRALLDWGAAAHFATSAVTAPPLPPFDSPLGRLVELDSVCSQPGSYTMVLAAEPGTGFGAAYFSTAALPVWVSTIEHEGRDVADIHSVTCIAPDSEQDSDEDGCMDVHELLFDPQSGGYRDPNNFWDFFDTPAGGGIVRDGAVSARDFFAVLQHFGSEGDPGIDPLSEAPETGYHPAYDRSGLVGPNAWNVGAADGAITAEDAFAVLAQFGHECE